MKEAYPAFIKVDDGTYYAFVPDFGIYMTGKSMHDAITVTRDAVGIKGLMLLDSENVLPGVSDPEEAVRSARETDAEYDYSTGVMTYIDVDFDEYRKRHNNRAVRKNVSIPKWMADRADQEDINLSRVLQEALAEIFRESENAVLG